MIDICDKLAKLAKQAVSLSMEALTENNKCKSSDPSAIGLAYEFNCEAQLTKLYLKQLILSCTRF